MEQRSVLLRGIARVLNAGGSALLNVYDAAASIKTIVLPGEKGNLGVQLREYEKKIEGLYREIGKEVVLRTNTAGAAAEDPAQLSAAGEAGIKRVAEYQTELEKIRQRIRKIEAEEKAAVAAKKEAAPERAAARVKTAPEPTAYAEESAVTELPEDSPLATEAATEETIAVTAEVAEKPKPEMVADAPESAESEAAPELTDDKPEDSADILVEAAATPEPELPKDTAESEASWAGATTPAAGTEETVTIELETLLKSDLLQICSEKGIEADKKMTKAQIIELLSGR